MDDVFIRTESYLFEIEQKVNEQRQMSELEEKLNKQNKHNIEPTKKIKLKQRIKSLKRIIK